MNFVEYLDTLKNLFVDQCVSFELEPLSSSLTHREVDFMVAPASTKHHMSFPHGLFIHTMNVWRNAVMLNKAMNMNLPERSVFIASICHDLCKVNYYSKESKWRKDSRGKWESYLAFSVDDSLPLGHGEKSLYLASKCIHLTNDEALAIRWHMAYLDPGVHSFYPSGASFKSAYNECPLLRLIHVADSSTALIEKELSFKDPYLLGDEEMSIRLDSSLQIDLR